MQAHLFSPLMKEEPFCVKEGAPSCQDALKKQNLRTTSSAMQTGFHIGNISCVNVFMVSPYKNVAFFSNFVANNEPLLACKIIIIYQTMMLINTDNF